MPASGVDRRLDISMMGTRGVPARYGGFETAVEEIGYRLVERGHRVTVYCRPTGEPEPRSFRGMRRIELPAVRAKSLETLSHTALSAAAALTRPRPDAVVLFNAANALLLPTIRRRGTPVAVHTDGLEWQRTKWSGRGRSYYRVAERLAVRWADALIADARGIADYYRDEFGASTELISYGAPIVAEPNHSCLADFDVEPGGYLLVVARFEPENHVEEIVRGFAGSEVELPLVVVGSAPYSTDYTARIEAIGSTDDRIRLVGGVWDQEALDALYAGARLYLHGHSVGGTNPSLLRAMGAGTPVAAWDVVFNREVMGDMGWYFGSAGELGAVLAEAVDRAPTSGLGAQLLERARSEYDWELVTDDYERLAHRLAQGFSRRGEVSGARRAAGPAELGAAPR
jgi:glycosyltransferase involved in cell wall biosynthesis